MIKIYIKIFIITCLLSFSISCSLLRTLPPMATDVTLKVSSSKPTYKSGEPIRLELTLTNNSLDALSVSPRWEGNISVVSLSRNGVKIQPVDTFTFYEVALVTVLKHSLISIKPSEDNSFIWGTRYDEQLSGQVLQTVALNAQYPHPSSLYPIKEPGIYKLNLVYQYSGPNGAANNVFISKTNHAEVKFTVVP